jgi:hypothetical protein
MSLLQLLVHGLLHLLLLLLLAGSRPAPAAAHVLLAPPSMVPGLAIPPCQAWHVDGP